MNFWDNVLSELEFQGKTRKWLAAETGINVSTIGIGQRRNSIPAADVALKIANALNVTIEYLLDLDCGKSREKNDLSIENELQLLRKYRSLIHNMETLSDKEKSAVENLVENLQEK